MKKLLALAFVLGIGFFAFGQEENKKNSFDEFQKAAQDSFQTFQKSSEELWNIYDKANEEAFNNFKKAIEEKWGDGNFWESTQKKWVEYNADGESRSEVDFDNNEATVQVIVDKDDAGNDALIKDKVASAVEELALNKGNTKDYSTEYEKPKELSDKPILEDQLETKDGKSVTSKNVKEYTKEVVDNTKIEKQPVKTKEGEKVIVSVKVPLAKNSVQTRALTVMNDVNKNAERFQVYPELILAVIETESSFNPKARSHIPAYGYMQIVPKYAGRDAYQYLYKEDKILNENYLYDGTKNIELGSTYLHLLFKRYFNKIENPKSRVYCAICAYNTGAGNVSRAFIGTTKIGNAIPEINKMTDEEVYHHLLKKLPYEETQKYLVKVHERMNKYKTWLSEQ